MIPEIDSLSVVSFDINKLERHQKYIRLHVIDIFMSIHIMSQYKSKHTSILFRFDILKAYPIYSQNQRCQHLYHLNPRIA